MQRFKHTFKRSKTPTGAEMKIQSSLEVPKQIRSASFDEMKLGSHNKRCDRQSPVDTAGLLKVPSHSLPASAVISSATGHRSKSFDYDDQQQATSDSADSGRRFLEVPSSSKSVSQKKKSGEKSPPFCVHCFYLEEKSSVGSSSRQSSGDDVISSRSLTYSDSSSAEDRSDSEDDYADAENSTDASECSPAPQFRLAVFCPSTIITTTDTTTDTTGVATSPSIAKPSSVFSRECPPSSLDIPKIEDEELPQTTSRRRSITSPKLERQHALILSEAQDASLESIPSCSAPTTLPNDAVVSEFFLAVPDLKRDRAVSVDSCFIQKGSHAGKPEEVQPVPASQLLEPPSFNGSAGNTARSRSVDIVLPTPEQARYKALSTTNTTITQSSSRAQQTVPTTATTTVVITTSIVGKGLPSESTSEIVARQTRATPDWSEQAVNSDHLWVPTSVSGDLCYVGETDCTKHGSRMKCSSCKIVAHTNCIAVLIEKIHFTCKPTFRDVGIRQYREHTCIYHHWAHRRSQKGKCKQCGKSFQSKLSFSSKEIVALSCSWCKTAYHNKETCFSVQRIEEECTLGIHSNIIVPPSWIVKLPRRGSFKSSLRKSPKKKVSSKKKTKEKTEKDQKTFVIKPIPTANVKPVIVFINPKSGGNQGAKLLQKFQWLLNPRQVFDLTQGGPKYGLELFRKVPNLRVLACGGDGTVGWILSILDQMEFNPSPPIGVLPLGTGNDLARALGWGGGYTDEPISKILCNIEGSEITKLDRWELKVENNPDSDGNEEGKDNLPLNVVNNYFSFGVDAHIALEFHEAREANPQKFNSRLRNKMFYGQMGGKDLLKRKWKNLAEVVKLECNGKDMTSKLKDLKVHAIVFLNIPSYGGGTHPWNKAGGNEQLTDDGMIEVIGLTTYQLPLLQAGGHGTCLCQCKTARIITSKTIPMQVDGEACKLKPSIITLNFLNQANMLSKRKGAKVNEEQVPEQLQITVNKINMNDYEQHHYDKDLLKNTAIYLGDIKVAAAADLEQVRHLVNKMQEEKLVTANTVNNQSMDPSTKLSIDWCFVDSCTAERFFRIDKAQEHLHYLTDIAQDALFVLDAAVQTPDDEGTFSPLPSGGDQTTPELSPSEESPSTSISKISVEHEKEVSLVVKKSNSQTSLDVINKVQDAGSDRSPTTTDNVYGSFVQTESSSTAASFRGTVEKLTEKILLAGKLGDLKTIKQFHNDGYSVCAVDEVGQTILHYAVLAGYREIVRYIIACGPPSILNMADYIGKHTALHLAAATKQRTLCCMLVAGGATLNLRDKNGNTPKALALKANDVELAAYLEGQEKFQLLSKEVETDV